MEQCNSYKLGVKHLSWIKLQLQRTNHTVTLGFLLYYDQTGYS